MKTPLTDGSGWRHYRYLFSDTDRHGNVRIYYRRKGRPYTRLRETPGTPEFDAEYQAAYQASTQPAATRRDEKAAPGSLQWLCERYYGSGEFVTLDASTQRVRRRILESICRRIGDLPFAKLQPRHVLILRDEKAAAPEAANSRVKTLRALFKWAIRFGDARDNPAASIGYLSSGNPDGFRAWTDDDVAAFEARYPIGTKARLALGLLLYTGVRASDVVRLGPQMERDGKLVFSEHKGRTKTAKPHALPIAPQLRASIDATPTGHLVYLVTTYGKPYSVKGFGNWFADQAKAAGLDGLSAHGLRKLAAIRAAEAGATTEQLKAWFGWTTGRQADTYTRRASRARLEAEAAALLRRG